MRKPTIMIALAAALPFAALAADPPSPGKSEPRICRTAQQTTGSHIRSPRTCHTAEQWRQIDEAPLPISLRVNASKSEGKPTRAQP